MNNAGSSYKAHAAQQQHGLSSFAKYRALNYGAQPLVYILKAELLTLLISAMPGALGLALRKWFYPGLFKSCGRGVIFGRNLTLRHAHKISLGDQVIIDDGVVLDAKGDQNRGVMIGKGAYVGRNTIIYCKDGDITLEDRVNVSSNVQIFSSNEITIGRDTVIAAFTYILSGGMYDYRDPAPFSKQSGMKTRGITSIGPNCWIGAHAVILDGVQLGEHVVVGAGAVVTGDIPGESMALGVPAGHKPIPADVSE